MTKPRRKAIVFSGERPAGRLEETDSGYRFQYFTEYLANPDAVEVSLSLPLGIAPYESKELFSFFHGLLAEGNLKIEQCRQLRIDENDHFGRLIKTAGGDVIGAVTVKEEL